jgi:hypothetical protein
VASVADDPLAKELVSERVSSLTEGVMRAMTETKIRLAVGVGFLAIALLGLGLGRLTVGTADAANPQDKKAAPLAGQATPKVPPPVENADPPLRQQRVAEDPIPHPAGRADAGILPPAPGHDLVVRRPLGSFTRDVTPFGRGTLTFTENRLHIYATVNVEKVSVTFTADADYSMNRESMVYGIITGVDVLNAGGSEAVAGLAATAALLSDIPFAFRVRVEDDAITIKDIKVGPFGSPLFAEVLGKGGDGKELLMVTGMVGGKYRADPNPDRNPPPRVNPGGPAPRLRRQAPPPHSSDPALPFPNGPLPVPNGAPVVPQSSS